MPNETTTHTFTLVLSVAGGTLEEARAYVTGVIEVGDDEERITNVETHDENMLADPVPLETWER